MTNLYSTLPSDFASNSEKKDKKYGAEVGQFIEGQWFNGQLTSRRNWITLMRDYARGEQSIMPYKQTIEGVRKGNKAVDIKTHKIDYKQLKVMATFKDIVINAIDESLFKPRAEAIDTTSVNMKKDYFKKLEKQFYNQEFDEIISKGIGIDLVDKNMPKDKDELDVRKSEFKPRVEIAQELAIENVMKKEKFEIIKDKIDEDLFDVGFGVAQHYTDFNEGIKFKYVDPYDYIHSKFEMDDGRDIRYHGVVRKGTLGDIIKMSGGMSDEDKDKIKKVAVSNFSQNSSDKYIDSEDSDRMIEYVSFAYLMTLEKIYKKQRRNKSFKLIDRSEDGYEPQNSNKKINIPYQVWFEGVYVPYAKVIAKWEPISNQVEAEVNKPISPFLIYAPKVKRLSESGNVRFDSIVQRSIPIIDDLHRDWYKFQQLKMELRPNTTEIDANALNNVILNGQKVEPQDLLDLFFGRSLLIKNGTDEDGQKLPDAISEKGGGVNNSALTFLSNEFPKNYDRLRQLLGINELRDGTTKPNSKTSVTVQKILLASSNNATSHIVKGSFNISLQIAESISLRLCDILTTPSLRNRYMDSIGSENVELLDAIKQYPMSKFAIYFDFKPDNEERLAFEQSLLNSYNLKEINVAQYNKARQVRNVKSAIKYLEYIIDENIRKVEENKRANIEAQAKANAQTSVLTEQTKQQTLTVSWTMKKQEMLLEAKLKADADKKKAILDELKAQENHKRAIELKMLENNNKRDIENEKENRKDDRIDQTSTNTSKITDQRQNKSGAIDFTNKIDDIFNDNELLMEQ